MKKQGQTVNKTVCSEIERERERESESERDVHRQPHTMYIEDEQYRERIRLWYRKKINYTQFFKKIREIFTKIDFVL